MKHLFSLVAFYLTLCAARADERPNILWIYLEDVSDWFSCNGDELTETPKIDQLANQ